MTALTVVLFPCASTEKARNGWDSKEGQGDEADWLQVSQGRRNVFVVPASADAIPVAELTLSHRSPTSLIDSSTLTRARKRRRRVVHAFSRQKTSQSTNLAPQRPKHSGVIRLYLRWVMCGSRKCLRSRPTRSLQCCISYNGDVEVARVKLVAMLASRLL